MKEEEKEKKNICRETMLDVYDVLRKMKLWLNIFLIQYDRICIIIKSSRYVWYKTNERERTPPEYIYTIYIYICILKQVFFSYDAYVNIFSIPSLPVKKEAISFAHFPGSNSNLREILESSNPLIIYSFI